MKLQRQRQNKIAYQRRILNSLSPTEPPSHVYPEFPVSLRCRAAYKICSTSHFIKGYHALSCPSLTLGILGPEYQPIISLDTTTDDRLILNVLHNVDGHQLRLLEEQGHKRHNLSIDDKSNRNLVQVMLEEIDAWLAIWIIYYNKFEQLEGLEWEVMTSELALEWGAKVIYTLRDEVRVSQLGYSQYLAAHARGGLSWQLIDLIG